MSTSDRAKALRDLADAMDGIGAAEERHAKALARYTEHQTPKAKAEFRAASEALVAARQSVRGDDAPRAVTPGDVSITPATAGGKH